MRRRTKIIIAVIAIAIVWPFAEIGIIAAQAQYYANGRPYCIEVSGSDRAMYYRSISSLSELNGFTLYAPYINGGGSGSTGSLQWTFNAVVVIDTGSAPEWRNWSYWHQHFDWLTRQQSKVTHLYAPECQPQVDFVLRLPLFAK
jgi:hypothetical protein